MLVLEKRSWHDLVQVSRCILNGNWEGLRRNLEVTDENELRGILEGRIPDQNVQNVEGTDEGNLGEI